MCPLWPAHYILMYMVLFGVTWLASFEVVGAAVKLASQYDVTFDSKTLDNLLMDETVTVEVRLGVIV